MNLPPMKTPFTRDEIIAAITTAFNTDMGQPPPHKVMAVLCAQVALETGDGAECIQHNVGNFKAGCSSDSCSFTTFEYLGKPPVRTTKVCSFSAWPSLADGCAYYIRALYTNWPEAWTAACNGDAEGFAAGLKLRDYFTAPVEMYAAGVKRWQAVYAEKLEPDAVPASQPIISPADAAAEALAGLDAGWDDPQTPQTD